MHAAKGAVVMLGLAAFVVVALTGLAADGVRLHLRGRSAARTAPQPAAIRNSPARQTSEPRRLSDLPVGSSARLHDVQLDPESRSQLRGLGLTDASVLRVCKQGEPCVVQVRTTRIGISGRIARHVFVVPADGRLSKDASSWP